MKLTTLMFGLLLAVGWTNVAQAQQLADQPLQMRNFTEFLNKGPIEVANVNGHKNGNLKAPSRTPNTITADVTHTYDWYDAITYDWVDANGGSHTNKITEPATTAEQMAYLLATTYMNPNIPGIQYTEGWETVHPYFNIGFGWDIPNNARWNYDGQTTDGYDNITISSNSTNGNYINYTRIYSISVVSGNTTITSWSYSANGTTLPSGWTFSGSAWYISSGYLYTDNTTDAIVIPGNLLTGYPDVEVRIVAKDNNYSTSGYRQVVVNGEAQNLTSGSDRTYTWELESKTIKTVTKPYENGYTVFLVKVKDDATKEPYWVYTWDNLINYFDTHIDEVQLLTDGTRLNEGTEDAGTMFAYSGELNRFYFASKGKMFYLQEDDLAPTNSMYEEFSAHQPTDGAEDITDFYSKLLYGNSYNVIHDCQGVNGLEHYFSMSGTGGSDHRSLTNLIFWIPDNRGVNGTRNYDEEYLPHVGLYTITLEATAVPSTTQPGYYDVTCDWVSSLNSILDFPVEQDYELWIYVYDEQGNPVEERLVTTTHDVTTHTYPEPQYPDSYTIIYRVKGWPTDATNNPARGGDFFAQSNLDPVLIPGLNDFLTLGVEHYESDFALDVEHNYYRNFLTVGNQNPENALTAKRIEDGETHFMLYRFDPDNVDDNNQPYLTKAADLNFSVNDNKVEYDIVYDNQFYVDEANLVHVDDNGQSHAITGYTDPNALDCPTHGEIAKISEGGGTPPEPVDEYVRINSLSELTSGAEYLIVCEQNSVALDGGLTDFYNTTSGFRNIINVSPDNGVIKANATTDAATFTITASGNGYTIKSKSGYYIGNASATNPQIQESQTTQYSNTITFDTNGNASILYTHTTGIIFTTTYNYYLKYNYASNMQRFAYTTATNNYRNIQLYKHVKDENAGFNLLNNFLDNSTYTQPGIVVFQLPWKSIQVKHQDTSAGSAGGYFFIQSGGKLRFIMPAGYNNANLKFIIHNAPLSSNYHDGTFTLSSTTGETETISFATTEGDVDRECIFTGISSGDVITITGTHTVSGTLYNYSPDFKYIHVYVEGGHDGISENQALNLDAIKFVDQFKAETKDDEHPYQYGYVLKLEGSDEESGKPQIPVQHTGSNLNGFYTLKQLQEDTEAPLLEVNVMNAEVNMTLSREPEIYYFTLDRKPSNVNNAQWEDVSKLQRREDDSYQEMLDNLPQYDNQICNPPAVTTPPTPWIVERYDNYDIKQGSYNSYMSYVPVIWTHGDQKNRRIKFETEKKHNSYGAPIWKTGVAEVTLTSAIAERQDNISTKWTYGGEDCSLYMLDNIEAVAKMPTVNNVKYVPYMFRIFVKSNNHKLRGYQLVAEDVDPNKPGEHFEGAAINDDELQCVWSGYVNDPKNEQYGVTINENEANGVKTYTFHKDKVDRTNPQGDWDKNQENAIFASLENLIQGEGENMMISGDDLSIIVRFYYIVEGFDASAPGTSREEGDDPAGYGAQGEGRTPSPWTAVSEIGYNSMIESVTYVNALGMQSDKPFDGMNIVITRYSNGTVSTTKVVR